MPVIKPKQIEILKRLAVVAALGLAVMLLARVYGPRPTSSSTEATGSSLVTASNPDTGGSVYESLPGAGGLTGKAQSGSFADYETRLARELEAVLSTVAGAGRVKVSVILESGPEYHLAQNEESTQRDTSEKDTNGGTRLVTELIRKIEILLVGGSSGSGGPVVTSVTRPKVAGVLVVADGASDSVVRSQLLNAVSTLLGVPAYKVQVIPSSGGN